MILFLVESPINLELKSKPMCRIVQPSRNWRYFFVPSAPVASASACAFTVYAKTDIFSGEASFPFPFAVVIRFTTIDGFFAGFEAVSVYKDPAGAFAVGNFVSALTAAVDELSAWTFALAAVDGFFAALEATAVEDSAAFAFVYRFFNGLVAVPVDRVSLADLI